MRTSGGRTDNHYEVVIVGAGSMGMAAGYYLGKQGVRTLLIDTYDPPHHFGSHHGETRIIRHAYGEGGMYVPLVLRAQELWGQLEEESGIKLFDRTGVLCAGIPGSSFIDEAIRSARQFGLHFESMTGTEINRRFPGLTVPNDFVGCLESDSGVLFSENCLEAYRQLIQEMGVTLLPNTAVMRIDIHPRGVTVKTKENDYLADQVVVSTGAWTKKLLENSGINLPLKPVRKTVSWYECDESLYQSSVFPAFTFDLLNEKYYGFPSFHGSGVKMGRHDGGEEVDPEAFHREFGSSPRDEEDARGFLQRFLPYANGKLKKGLTCLYTFTPDEDFIIDRHPKFHQIIIAAGFSGHGFKFSSVIGELISELVTKGMTTYDISMFTLQRKSLT